MTRSAPIGSKALYLLDANVLITAHRDYYPVKRIPEFWDWLQHHAEAGTVKVPAEILDEVKRGKPRQDADDLLDWLKDPNVKDAIPLDEEPDPALVWQVVEQGYAPNLSEPELVKLGRDPFLIPRAARPCATKRPPAPG